MFKISIFLLGLLFLVSCTHNAINHSTEEEKELNTINDLYKNTALEIKIYFDSKDIESFSTSKYIIRQSNTSNPLDFSIRSYLDGVSEEEVDLGFKTNNLGIEYFKIKVKDRTALINFISKDLNIESPEQILNFDYNIFKKAEQFDYIDDVKICINNISNYQMSFLANEQPIKCPF